MTAENLAESLIAALGLPARCRVDQRVPKKMLIDHGAPTAADKRLLNDHIESVQWLAALKPHTIGVPIWRDDEREYLEIAVLAVTLRRASVPPAPSTSLARLTELLHRAVPYPVLLLLDAPHGLSVSAAHKRWAHNEAGKVVLDGDVLAAAFTPNFCTPWPCASSRTRTCWRCTKAGWPACWPCRWRSIPISFYAKTACSPC